MATNFTSWYAEIQADIPSAPAPAIDHALINASREFCKRTLLWEYDIPRISITADDRQYTLDVSGADVSAEIISAENVKYKIDGADDDQFYSLWPISERAQNKAPEIYEAINFGTTTPSPSGSSWYYQTASSPSHFWLERSNKDIMLWPIPEDASASGLLVKVNLRPARTVTSLPDWMYEDYFMEIAMGAKADLFRRPGQPWFSQELAGILTLQFRNECNNLIRVKHYGETGRGSRVRMKGWW